MFTGIIETLGTVKEITNKGRNKIFWIESPISSELKVDQSISHCGVCLTIEEIVGKTYRVTAVAETLQKTALNNWVKGSLVNLERSLLPSSRLDGHFVQGHVDATGICKKIKDAKGSWELTFSFPKTFSSLIIEKGSVSVNGISLTAFNVKKNSFKVAVIPYTWKHTNLHSLKKNNEVNIEFDVLGKYLLRRAQVYNQ